MFTLQPFGEFVVTRQISNHLDTGTYYVRGVIRYAYTDVLIENLDLTNKGSQRFSKNWRAPADVSGQGTWISIVTSVYTDSGYTSKSENYGDEENTYLVQERVLGSLKSGGGGGLDMRTTRRIIAEELEKIKFPKQEKISIPEQKEYDSKFSEISKELTSIKDLIGDLPAENNDLRPLMIRLNELAQEVKTKPVTPITDLAPISEKVEDIKEENNININEIRSLIQIIENSLTKEIEKIKDFIPEAIGNANFTIPIQAGQQPQKQEPQFNINNLAK